MLLFTCSTAFKVNIMWVRKKLCKIPKLTKKDFNTEGDG
jgi:hypothetical protein